MACGVSPMSYRNWRHRAEEWIVGDEPVPESERIFIEFFWASKWAEARAEIDLLRRAARGERGWQAAMTVLERKYPSRWGRSEKRIHEGGDPSKPVAFELKSDDARRKEVAKILQQVGALNGDGGNDGDED